MIVVVGQPVLRRGESGAEVDGLAGRIAVAAASNGRPVQLVGTAGEDEAGEQVLLALARIGVGHVAVLRKVGLRTPTVWAETRRDPRVDIASAILDADADDAAPVQPVAHAPLDAGDVELALRYLADFDVLVLADSTGHEPQRAVIEAAGWAGARLVVILQPGDAPPTAAPNDAIVFEAPAEDPDGAFASMVGAFAAALDEGEEAADAFSSSVSSSGWVESPLETETTP